MDIFSIIAILTVLSAAFGFINARFLKLPDTIGLMIIAIVFTLVLLAGSYFYAEPLAFVKEFMTKIDFSTLLLEVMLSFLLFAGALHTNFQQLKVQRYPILIFATVGVITSTFLIAGGMFFLLKLLGLPIDFIYCLLFGALISPTDPIAVLGILKKAGVPKILETKIVGESLFNDGIGVVVFLTIYHLAEAGGGSHFSAFDVGQLFLVEVGGGILLGLILGYIAFKLMKSIDNWEIEVLITLAIVMGGYALCNALHISGPLCMVVAGLIVGHSTVRDEAMSEITESYVDKFWELIDVSMNAILFVMIGLELLILTYTGKYILAGILAIPLVLAARAMALFAPIEIFKKKLDFVPKTNLMMTWGGLRGGISIALALSLADFMHRDLILTVTYVVVVFSIVVQGLTVGKLVKKLGIGDPWTAATRDEH